MIKIYKTIKKLELCVNRKIKNKIEKIKNKEEQNNQNLYNKNKKKLKKENIKNIMFIVLIVINFSLFIVPIICLALITRDKEKFKSIIEEWKNTIHDALKYQKSTQKSLKNLPSKEEKLFIENNPKENRNKNTPYAYNQITIQVPVYYSKNGMRYIRKKKG